MIWIEGPKFLFSAMMTRDHLCTKYKNYDQSTLYECRINRWTFLYTFTHSLIDSFPLGHEWSFLPSSIKYRRIELTTSHLHIDKANMRAHAHLVVQTVKTCNWSDFESSGECIQFVVRKEVYYLGEYHWDYHTDAEALSLYLLLFCLWLWLCPRHCIESKDRVSMDLIHKHQGPLLLTWFNFNPCMDE